MIIFIYISPSVNQTYKKPYYFSNILYFSIYLPYIEYHIFKKLYFLIYVFVIKKYFNNNFYILFFIYYKI